MRLAIMFMLATVCNASIEPVATTPEVRSPVHGQHIGEAGDPQCEPKQPCSRIRVEGWTPPGRTPFLIVAPVKAAPQKWVQPRIDGVAANGSFSALAYLGESHNGARQWFKIFVYACESAEQFAEGDQFTDRPDGCVASDPVEVYRER